MAALYKSRYFTAAAVVSTIFAPRLTLVAVFQQLQLDILTNRCLRYVTS